VNGGNDFNGPLPETFPHRPPSSMPSQLTGAEADQILQNMLDRPPTADTRPEVPEADMAIERAMFNEVLDRVNDGTDYNRYERMRDRKHAVDRELYRRSQQPENQPRLSKGLSEFLNRPVSDFTSTEALTVGLEDFADDIPAAIQDIGADSDPLQRSAGHDEDLRQYQYRTLQSEVVNKYKEVVNAWYGEHEESLRAQGHYENKQELLNQCWEQERQVRKTTLPPLDPAPGTMSWVPKFLRSEGYESYTPETSPQSSEDTKFPNNGQEPYQNEDTKVGESETPSPPKPPSEYSASDYSGDGQPPGSPGDFKHPAWEWDTPLDALPSPPSPPSEYSASDYSDGGQPPGSPGDFKPPAWEWNTPLDMPSPPSGENSASEYSLEDIPQIG
jgi:hypothetical protein